MHYDNAPLRAWRDQTAKPHDFPEEEIQPLQQYRTLWISDLHLGTPGCQADALLDFLKHTECETLYLVGDIVDGWQLRRQWYWPQTHNDVVQKLLRKARKGTRVIFIPGNHDEFARKYLHNTFGGIEVVDEWIHHTADGRKLWITHGDLFDGVVQCAKWLAYLGDSLYEFTLKLNRRLNSQRARMGLPYWSLSKYLKLKVKRAVSYVSDFEHAVAHEARKRGAQGVVCGPRRSARHRRHTLRQRRRLGGEPDCPGRTGRRDIVDPELGRTNGRTRREHQRCRSGFNPTMLSDRRMIVGLKPDSRRVGQDPPPASDRRPVGGS